MIQSHLGNGLFVNNFPEAEQLLGLKVEGNILESITLYESIESIVKTNTDYINTKFSSHNPNLFCHC